jgi:hypothetical protein
MMEIFIVNILRTKVLIFKAFNNPGINAGVKNNTNCQGFSPEL